MTAKKRIEAAIAARDKATPGPWKAELCLGGSYVIDNTLPENGGKVRRIAEVYGHLSTPSDARFIAAAPDLVDEVIRLRKLLSGAVEMLDHQNMYFFNTGFDEEEYQINLEKIRRLIAEAQED